MTNKLRTLLDAYVFDDEGENFEVRATEPGGAVKLGVSFEIFQHWHAVTDHRHVTFDDLRNMTRDTAEQIYRDQFWNQMHGEELPAGVSYAVFDPVMNSGMTAGIKILQRALGFPDPGEHNQPGLQTADGHLGIGTFAAVKACTDYWSLIDSICAKRLEYMHTRPGWPMYRGGWTDRVDRVKSRAKKLLTPSVSA